MKRAGCVILLLLSSCTLRPAPIIVEIDTPLPTSTTRPVVASLPPPTVEARQERAVEIDLFYPDATPAPPLPTVAPTPSATPLIVPLAPPPPAPTPTPLPTPEPTPLPTATPSLVPRAQTYVINAEFIAPHDPYGVVPIGANSNAILLHTQIPFDYVPGQKLVLYGGPINTATPRCCIGSNGMIDIWINGDLIFSSVNKVYPDAYDLTSRALPFVRPGTNVFEIRLAQHNQSKPWASPLSLHIEMEQP